MTDPTPVERRVLDRIEALEQEVERIHHVNLRLEQSARETEHHFSGIVRELSRTERRLNRLSRRMARLEAPISESDQPTTIESLLWLTAQVARLDGRVERHGDRLQPPRTQGKPVRAILPAATTASSESTAASTGKEAYPRPRTSPRAA